MKNNFFVNVNKKHPHRKLVEKEHLTYKKIDAVKNVCISIKPNL